MSRRGTVHPTHLFDDVAGERLCVGCWCVALEALAQLAKGIADELVEEHDAWKAAS